MIFKGNSNEWSNQLAYEKLRVYYKFHTILVEQNLEDDVNCYIYESLGLNFTKLLELWHETNK